MADKREKVEKLLAELKDFHNWWTEDGGTMGLYERTQKLMSILEETGVVQQPTPKTNEKNKITKHYADTDTISIKETLDKWKKLTSLKSRDKDKYDLLSGDYNVKFLDYQDVSNGNHRQALDDYWTKIAEKTVRDSYNKVIKNDPGP